VPRRRTPRPRTARRRLVIIVVVAALVLLGGGGVLAWRLTRTDAAATTTQRTVAVSKETVKDTVGTTGTVEPARRADLTFSAAGTVTAVKVEVGDKVDKGDVLATLDDTDLQADVEAAQADLEAAQDDLTTAEADSTTTTAELNAAKAKVAVQKGAVSSAESALKAADLRATFSGTVAAVGVAKGDTVGSSASGSSGGSGSSGSGSTSGSTSTSSTAAVTVISSDRYTVAASVGSADLARVKKGLQAQITTTGSTTTIFGTVSSVAVMASSGSSSSGTSGSATFDVTIDVTGSQKSLYAGASATVTILVSQRADVLTVPTAALTTVSGKTMVNKLVDGKPVQTEVTLGQSYGATTEVTKGLAEGDQVVLSTAARVPGSGASQRGTSGGYGGGGYTGGGGFPGAGTGGGFPAGGTGGAPAQGGSR
jgi:multidrug efflux pump subunit AcrA (membrane-fusion protein)